MSKTLCDIDDAIVFDGAVVEPPQFTARAGAPKVAGDVSVATEDAVVDAIKLVFDPDVNIDVYNLGLIYAIDIREDGNVFIDMTLTSPTCPMAEILPALVADMVAGVEGVGEVEVKLVWEPAWDLSRLSDEAKFQMDMGDLDLSF